MTKKKTGPHLKSGAPTKFKPEYCEKLIKFFSTEPYREKETFHSGKNGQSWSTYEDVANDLPTFERFAVNIGVDTDTLLEWSKDPEKYPGFSVAYKRAKHLQKDILLTNGLRGLYSQPFAIFTAKNITDMRDRVEQDITSGGEKLPTPIMVIDPNVYTNHSNTENSEPKTEN